MLLSMLMAFRYHIALSLVEQVTLQLAIAILQRLKLNLVGRRSLELMRWLEIVGTGRGRILRDINIIRTLF